MTTPAASFDPDSYDDFAAQRLRLARWMSSSSEVLLVDPENRGAGKMKIDDAVADDRCFAVDVRKGIVCFDVDDPNSENLAKQFTDAAAASKLPFLQTRTSPGRSHLFLVVGAVPADILAFVRFAGRRAGFDIRRTIRPPGTIHRSGKRRSELIAGDFDSVVGAWPSDGRITNSYLATARAFLQALGIPTLSKRLAKATLRGSSEAGYESPSEFRAALAVWATANGFDHQLVAELFDAANMGQRWHARSGQWKTQEVNRLMQKASRWVETVDPELRWQHLDRHEWVGRAAVTDRAVLESLVRSAGVALDVAMSVAELAVSSGVSYPTARRSTDRLVEAGLIAVIEEPTTTHATLWRPIPEIAPATSTVTRHPKFVVGLASDLGADHVVAGCAGRAPMLVWRELDAEVPSKVSDLANAMGLTKSAMRGRLGRLRDAGLAHRAQDGWVRAFRDPTEISALNATSGRRARKMAELNEVRSVRAQQRRQAAIQVASPPLT